MEHLDIKLVVMTPRPESDIVERLPPVTPQPIEWRHICRDMTRRHYRYVGLVDGLLWSSILFAAIAFYQWFPLVLGLPSVILTAVGAFFGVPWIGWGGLIVTIAVQFWRSPYFHLGTNYESIYTFRDNYRKEQTEAETKHDKLAREEATAIEEELWFREGAEDWSFWQRTRSHVEFVRAHCYALWAYPWVLMLMYGAASLGCMRAYRHTYRRTHSRETALRTAATYHLAANTRHDHAAAERISDGLTLAGLLAGLLFQALRHV